MEFKIYPSVMDVHIVENGEVVAETTLTSQVPHFSRTWQMAFIEVAAKHRRRGYGARLYKWAKAYAVARQCQLLPSPDLTWDGFAFWRAMDPEALFEVLNHKSSIESIEDDGCDVERFQEQITMLKVERAYRVGDAG